MLTSPRNLILVIFTAALLAGCSGAEFDPTKDWTAEDFYDEAKSALNAGEFQTAIKNLETLEARFPFDPYAKQAQLDIAYSYYKFDEAETAISSIDRFIRLHPRDSHIDYALYLKGLINFNRGKGLLESWFPHDMSKHDTEVLKTAFNDFSSLIKRFPDSRYAGDAQQRIIYLVNQLAAQEIDNARYYIKRKTWLAAANRAKTVIEIYPTSIWRGRALEILVLAYENLGLNDLAADTRRVIQLNKNNTRKLASQQTFKQTLVEPPRLVDTHSES